MGHVAILVFLIAFALFLILGKEKNRAKWILQRGIGYAIFLGVIVNFPNTLSYLNQIYFMKNKSIVKIDLTPFESYCSNKKLIQQSVSITSENQISKLKKTFSDLNAKSPRQPVCKKSFWISFKDENGKSYNYNVKYTSNNGTLITTDIGWISFGTYRNDQIFKTAYELTNQKFYSLN